ncbi:MAG: protein TolQ [Alphaproteobacteria bacterium]
MEGLLTTAVEGIGHLGGWLANAGYTLLAEATSGAGGAVIGGGTTIGGGSTIERINLGGSQAPLDLSIWGMFINADIIVKVVIVVLMLASFWSWAIIFEKLIQVRAVNRRSNKFEDDFWSGGSVDELYERLGQRPGDPMSSIFASAMREWKRVPGERKRSTAQNVTLQERVERVMNVTLSREMERLERWLGFLASVGATAPFIGLFGTVWGIMNSFSAIAVQKNTNLSVVAPGIAEALLATALGLVAAIPAVVAFNKFSNDLGRYGNRLDGFAGEFTAIMSRQIEEKEH